MNQAVQGSSGATGGSVGIVTKRVFELPAFTTANGTMLANVRVGYETYGTLNDAGDNAILIAHHFSGTSHAAGKYADSDPAPGFWDAVIGPGKPIDTNRFFVVSSDTLVNVNTKDPTVTTTGPASVDPRTGIPYGMTFPTVAMRDFVRVQKALVDSLNIKRLVATAGPSGGAMQAMQWAADYPEMVDRVIAVVGPGLATPSYDIAMFNVWGSPIRSDPNWNHGDYYGKTEPTRGLADAFKLLTFSAVHFGWADENLGTKPASAGSDPGQRFDNEFLVESALQAVGASRATLSDANSFLYMAKAGQLFDVRRDVGKIKA